MVLCRRESLPPVGGRPVYAESAGSRPAGKRREPRKFESICPASSEPSGRDRWNAVRAHDAAVVASRSDGNKGFGDCRLTGSIPIAQWAGRSRLSAVGAPPAGQHLGDQLGSGHGGQAYVRMAREGPPVTAGFRPPQQFQQGPSPVNNLYGNYS